MRLRYRFLFSQLVRREMRQKYAGSSLGVAWYVVNPIVLMGAYTLMFGKLIPQNIPDYPLFLMVGIMIWAFFSQSLTASAYSLIEQAPLVRKARFPRETIPAASVFVQFVTWLLVTGVLVVVTLALRVPPGLALLLLPVLSALLFAFVLGCSVGVAALHAHFRDVAPVLTAALLPWFFLSPIFFEPDRFGFVHNHAWVGIVLNWINPIAPYIQAIRDVVYDGAVPDAGRLVYCALGAVVAVALGTWVFSRLDGELAVVL